ncbi:DUF805 domain-containing protein [Acinetobacter portensis]|uniref:DUF805 domain-containing protein n=2 Tax=Acinetobacter TaxID=469 RepID=A0A6L6GEZ4_9GAMM|nr:MULTISPECIES: DUF805 domain-containing protein [Acinetobacter]MCK7608886.1 DUF805 domain-containing protein [Acinetobacter portensis]MCK7639700.1 DUF805 domain-containing protein [Acinetobacter portensis]MDY6459143.1 DUF805 domain-containing protein [Acinetobacter faecalis]MDY6486374.1 DUF805 domain-containing protein [Acinetobacter faecalis]MDY6489344.1 DUF805 domain-containing protein [Acinetobacter faecalis]
MNPNQSSNFFSRQQTQIQDNPLSLNGRFGRLSYIAWYGFLNLITFFAVITLSLALGIFNLSTQSLDSHFIDTLMGLGGLGFLIISVLYFYFNLVIQVRRFHDMNRSGWFILLFIVPLVNIFVFFYLLLGSGTQGINHYGPQRISAIWEKILAWFMIVISILSILGTGSLMSYMMGAGQLETPTEILEKSTDYF